MWRGREMNERERERERGRVQEDKKSREGDGGDNRSHSDCLPLELPLTSDCGGRKAEGTFILHPRSPRRSSAPATAEGTFSSHLPAVCYSSSVAPGQEPKCMRSTPPPPPTRPLSSQRSEERATSSPLPHGSPTAGPCLYISLCIARHKSAGCTTTASAQVLFFSIGLADLVAFQIDKHKQHLSTRPRGGLNQRVWVPGPRCLHLP